MVCRPGGQSRKPRDYISATGTKQSELDVGQTYVLSKSPSPGDLFFLARLHLLKLPKLWGQSVQIPKSVGRFLIQITTGAVVESVLPHFSTACVWIHMHTHSSIACMRRNRNVCWIYMGESRDLIFHTKWTYCCAFSLLCRGKYYYLIFEESKAIHLLWHDFYYLLLSENSQVILQVIWSGVNLVQMHVTCLVPVCRTWQKTFVTLYFYNSSLGCDEAPSS